jgi:hypothetical protein
MIILAPNSSGKRTVRHRIWIKFAIKYQEELTIFPDLLVLSLLSTESWSRADLQICVLMGSNQYGNNGYHLMIEAVASHDKNVLYLWAHEYPGNELR